MEKTRLQGNLYYLTGQFPPRYGTYDKCAARLNKKGITTETGLQWTRALINNAIRGHTPDERVRLELISMLAEVEGRTSDVKSYLEAAERVLELERA